VRTAWRRWAPWLVLAALLVPPPAAGQNGSDAAAVVLSSPQVRYSLARLQEGWLEWTTALYSDDLEEADRVIERLEEIVRRLGMRSVPDLAAGALVQAVESARRGEEARATLALEAAERLAPGRPETAFAAAEVARLSGDWPGMIVAEARGYARLPRTVLERRLALFDVALWGLASLLVVCAFFVLLEMGLRGPAVARDLGRALGGRFRRLRGVALTVVVGVALFWPLVLPSGPLWLLLYWSFLLWGYLAATERAVLVLTWLTVVVAPTLVAEIDDRAEASLSPAVRAMESVAHGELYGGLFADLGVLPATLPEEPAVEHFLADLYVRLGQWEEARRRYGRVLDAEPDNVAALVNVGVYYFHREDFGNAVNYLRQAADSEAGEEIRAAALYDLSLAYTDANLFDEARSARLAAREIDEQLVSEWHRRPESQDEGVVTVDGGLARRGELERALRERRPVSAVASPALAVLRQARAAILVLVLALAAIATHAVVRHRRGPAKLAGTEPKPPGRWSRLFVPGLTSLREGHGARAFGALLLVVAPLLALLRGPGGLGYELPWRHDPGGWFLPAIALLVLVVVMTARFVRSGRGRFTVRGGG
jgi:tetratricopeptide (TPR) repeat protein